ncbi:MAG TPA: hypothetical protein DD979_05740 [Gammaproteobacteria bacterium]|jgi:hypothetical protein|nr:hypothetical protein [Gammaproteobacteria bacterium]
MKNNVLPLALYSNPGVKAIIRAEDSCILYKRLTGDLREQEKISTSHCMTFVAKGTVQVKTYEGHCVTAGENELLFMPQDTYTISDLILDDDAIEVFLVFFDQEIAMDFLRATGMKRYPTHAESRAICKLNTGSTVPQYFTALKEMYLSIDSAPHLLKIKILEFLHLVHRDNPRLILSTLTASDVQKRRRSIETIMLNNYDSA